VTWEGRDGKHGIVGCYHLKDDAIARALLENTESPSYEHLVTTYVVR
jgi:hypothetical protein